jgi:hypothetical protein
VPFKGTPWLCQGLRDVYLKESADPKREDLERNLFQVLLHGVPELVDRGSEPLGCQLPTHLKQIGGVV